MTQAERDQVEFVAGLRLADYKLHEVEDAVGELREFEGADQSRMQTITNLLGDVFFLLGQQIEAAESEVVVQ